MARELEDIAPWLYSTVRHVSKGGPAVPLGAGDVLGRGSVLCGVCFFFFVLFLHFVLGFLPAAFNLALSCLLCLCLLHCECVQ